MDFLASLSSLPLRRVPVQERSRLKVARALSAAAEILRAEGPEAISLTKVATAAGLSDGALYQYLPDRDHILQALVAGHYARVEHVYDDVQKAIDDGAPTDGVVEQVISALADVYREDQPVRLVANASTSRAGLDQRDAHRERVATKLTSALRASGLVPDATPERIERMAKIAFLTGDALLRDTFESTDADRGWMLVELGEMLRLYLSPRPHP